MKTPQDIQKISDEAIASPYIDYQSADEQWDEQDFLTIMSHEIRTPLHSIISMVHLLRSDPAVNEQLNYLKNLEFSAHTLMGIVNDVLDYKKIASGKLSIDTIPFNINELVEDIRQSQMVRAEEKGIRLKIRMDSDLPEKVQGDPLRLTQILNNLISNAIKFTPKGYVWLDVEVLETDEQKVLVSFKVSDTGVGVSMEKQQTLFKPFMQAGEGNSRQFGAGLGLYITKELVALQQGTLHFKSKASEGTCVTVTLPYELVPTATEDKNNLDSKGGGATILLAEDNKMNAFFGKRFLEKWGMRVDIATTGRQTVDKVLKRHYDLVLMDLQMPDIDGFEAFQLIRDAGYKDLPVIAFSASSRPSDKKLALELGMEAYIEKPFSPPVLQSKIQEILQRSFPPE